MKRQEFIDRWCDVVRAGRKRYYPEITNAEQAASAWEDRKKALSMWRRYRLHQCTPEQLERILQKDSTVSRKSPDEIQSVK